MDGREYISAFRIREHPDFDMSSLVTQEQANRIFNCGLTDMVLALYRDGQVHELTSNPPPPIVEEAAQGLMELRESNAAARPTHTEDMGTRRRNAMLRPDTVLRPEPHRTSGRLNAYAASRQAS